MDEQRITNFAAGSNYEVLELIGACAWCLSAFKLTGSYLQ